MVKWIKNLFKKKERPMNKKTSISEDTSTRENVLPFEWKKEDNVPSMIFAHKTLVIGVGGAGTKVLNYLGLINLSGFNYNELDFAIIDFDFACREPYFIRNHIMLNEFTACGTTLEYNITEHYDTSYYEMLVSKYERFLQPILAHSPERLIFVCGLGGTSGYGVYALIKYFLKKNISVEAIVSRPFKFEGKRRQELAEQALAEIQDLLPDSLVIYNQNSAKKDWPLSQVFTYSNHQMAIRIREIVNHQEVNSVVVASIDDLETDVLNTSSSLSVEEYGQVQTLCDIIKVLNEQKHYTCVGEMNDDINKVMDRYCRRGTISARTRHYINSGLLEHLDLFKEGTLDFEALKTTLLIALYRHQDDDIEKVMTRRDVAKLIHIISYLNDFRRYTSGKEIQTDLIEHVFSDTLSHGDLSKDYLNDKMFRSAPLGGHAYPYFTFFWALDEFWDKVSVDEILDNQKLQTIMIDKYQQDVAEYGIAKVVSENYEQDSSCHPEVYCPKHGEYYGPVLVSVEDERKFIESCGEGKGPNSSDDYFEFRVASSLLAIDPKYTEIGTDKDFWDHYYVPKQDFTLPVYGNMGKVYFNNQIEKESFIRKLLEK